MNISKNVLWLFFLIVFTTFIYLVRSVLTPFVLAAIFAYIFNPIVSLFQKRLRVPRTMSTILIYIALLLIIAFSFSYVGTQLINEASQLSSNDRSVDIFGQDFSSLPEWNFAGRSIGLQSLAHELVATLGRTAKNLQDNFWPYFTVAANQIINLLVFLVAAFYFLKEGSRIFNILKSWISKRHHDKYEKFLFEINQLMGNYLRGQVLLVLIMSGITWLALSILGVRFSLVLGIVTGFLELIPYMGPTTAIVLVGLTAFLTGNNNLGLDPVTLTTIVVLMLFVFRQFEDYFVIPQVLGRATKLHPLIVLFAVIAGGHLAGPLGFILAVPVAASVRVLVPYLIKESE